MKKLLVMLLLLMVAATVHTKPATDFKGLPVLAISEDGVRRISENLTPDRAASFACVINKIRGSYYWTSQGNVKLSRTDSGAFSTFMAEDGSGYVRMLNPDLEDALSLVSKDDAKYDYQEHLFIGLRSIIYYGFFE